MGTIHCWRNQVVVTAFALACLLPGDVALGTSGPSRAEYAKTVEGICKQGTQRHGGVLRGIDAMVRQGKLKGAGRRFQRAATALLSVIGRIGRVQPPPVDAARIDDWLGHGKVGVSFLRRIGRELIAGHRATAEAKADRLLAEIRRANTTVIGFDFDSCRLQPARFV